MSTDVDGEGGGGQGDTPRFVVGTCSLRESNELHIIGFHEESNELLCDQVCGALSIMEYKYDLMRWVDDRVHVHLLLLLLESQLSLRSSHFVLDSCTLARCTRSACYMASMHDVHQVSNLQYSSTFVT